MGLDLNGTPKTWDMDGVGAQLSFLQGEVLTILDAALTGRQLEAAKDLVKRAFRDRQRHMRGVTGEPDGCDRTTVSGSHTARFR
jgi:hypothetical protein